MPTKTSDLPETVDDLIPATWSHQLPQPDQDGLVRKVRRLVLTMAPAGLLVAALCALAAVAVALIAYWGAVYLLVR